MSETSDVVTPTLRALRNIPGVVAERVQSGTRGGGKMRLASPGAPDIWCICMGVALLFECKAEGGKTKKKTKEAQAEYHERVRRCGGVVLVITKPAQAIEVVRKLMETKR